ncbi:STAS domain-containing protein [Actinokineospora bangkokensis]|uniref:STAS domain-containing protein n=1 Tax=Actinokineospora bangkokensis TaxID=1193682 RepID=UPI001300F672|nr:STAS domain-containing protein [Actinokineospora bangkokensis]
MAAIAEPHQPHQPPDALLPDRPTRPRLPGHADLTTRPDFEALLSVLCSRAAGDVHLDLGELDFIDVSGVISLLRAAATLPEGSHLVLSNPPEAMRRILEVLNPGPDPGIRLA